MDPWLETLGAVCVALLGIVLGRVFSRMPKFYWTLGCLLPLALIGILLAARWDSALPFARSFNWIVLGRTKFVILSLVVTVGLTTPLSRLPHRFERLIVCIVMALGVVWISVVPFLVPALIRDHLSALGTRLDSNGVCLQTTRYTCGPAAAVTALGKLGLSGEEGEIAVLSRSSPVLGTLPACLSAALENRYASDGLTCQLRHFDSVDQLRDAGITLAVVRDAFLLDHCLAVLEVSDSIVTVADPVFGRRSMTYEQFEKIWRFSGIVLRRDTTHSI